MTLQTGQVLNQRYRIVKLLGQGGFGAVYRAWDTSFDLPCAVKENIETSPDARRQFMREAQLLHTLRHPNLPLVKDYFVIPEQGQYLVMDYVEGEDLDEILKRNGGPLPEACVVEWLATICEALTYLHTHTPPIIHRDIKPANIKIAPVREESTQARDVLSLPPNETCPYLVDFGISKVYRPESRTTQGARAITPGYSPFEQYGQAPTDARTDVYALGATAYTLLTGSVPLESLSRMSGEELPKPSKLNPSISSQVEYAILRAMQVIPDQRFASADEFRLALKAPIREPDLVRPQPPTVSAVNTNVQQPSYFQTEHVQRRGDTGILDVLPTHRKRSIWPWFVVFSVLFLTVVAAIVVWQRSDILTLVGIRSFAPTQEQPVEPSPEIPPTELSVREPIPPEFPPTEMPVERPVEPPPPEPPQSIPEQPGQPPPEVGPMAGEWSGVLREISGDKRVYELKLFIEHPPGRDAFRGSMEIRLAAGHVETREIVEGIFLEKEFRMKDNTDLHYWGVFEGDHLVGQAAWGCYHCAAWAEFEFFR